MRERPCLGERGFCLDTVRLAGLRPLRFVPSLRDSRHLLAYPALTRWANDCRRSAAGCRRVERSRLLGVDCGGQFRRRNGKGIPRFERREMTPACVVPPLWDSRSRDCTQRLRPRLDYSAALRLGHSRGWRSWRRWSGGRPPRHRGAVMLYATQRGCPGSDARGTSSEHF